VPARLDEGVPAVRRSPSRGPLRHFEASTWGRRLRRVQVGALIVSAGRGHTWTPRRTGEVRIGKPPMGSASATRTPSHATGTVQRRYGSGPHAKPMNRGGNQARSRGCRRSRRSTWCHEGRFCDTESHRTAVAIVLPSTCTNVRVCERFEQCRRAGAGAGGDRGLSRTPEVEAFRTEGGIPPLAGHPARSLPTATWCQATPEKPADRTQLTSKSNGGPLSAGGSRLRI
jgi:hypothetical protein